MNVNVLGIVAQSYLNIVHFARPEDNNEHIGLGAGDTRALIGATRKADSPSQAGAAVSRKSPCYRSTRETRMNKLEFVDTHVHLYDMQHPELVYGHWQPSEPHPVIGWQIRKLAEKNYVAEDYIAETRNANVTKAVHVQAAFGNPDPVTETEWLQEAADEPASPTA